MHLTLHLTSACNMRCSYCYSPPHAGAVMPEDVGRAAMDMGARDSAGSCGIIFFGGEPLLHKDLIRSLVAHGQEDGRPAPWRYHFKLTTNGILLDEEFLDFCQESGVLVAMSFDGIREAHDAHRRLPDGSPTFDLLLPKLKLLLAARPYSSVLMVVNPDTARYFAESVSFLMDLGCRYLVISLNYAGPWTERDFRTLEAQYKRIASLYIEGSRRGRKFYLSPFEVKISSHIAGDCYQKEQCELGVRQLSVDAEGHIYPCVQFVKAGPDSEWCIGNVFNGIDEGARQRIHDTSEAEKEPCRGCAIERRCNNSCGCLNWQTTGTVTSPSPVLCRHEQMLVPIADRVAETLYKERNPHFLHKHYNAAYPILSLMEDVLSE